MECIMHLHLSFMNLITLSIMSTCSSFPYISTIIGRRCYFNCAMLNSFSPWMMVTLKPRASHFSSTMSITVLILTVDLDLHGWAVTRFNFSGLVVRKGYPLKKNKSMYNFTSLWCYDIGNVGGMRSILSGFGWCLVILPCNKGFAGQ